MARQAGLPPPRALPVGKGGGQRQPLKRAPVSVWVYERTHRPPTAGPDKGVELLGGHGRGVSERGKTRGLNEPRVRFFTLPNECFVPGTIAVGEIHCNEMKNSPRRRWTGLNFGDHTAAVAHNREHPD